MAGAKRDGEKWHDGRVGEQREAIALSDCGEQQRRFHHRETGAYAHARAAAEWKVSKARNAAAANGIDPPALGIESHGIGEEARVAMRDPLKNKNVGARANAVATDLEVADGAPANAPRWRIGGASTPLRPFRYREGEGDRRERAGVRRGLDRAQT